MMIKADMNDTHSFDLSLTDLAAEIDDEISRELHGQQDDTAESKAKVELENIGRHICFNIPGNQLSIPLSSVLEAGELQVVQPLPFLPDWLEGITNIRGEIISVINLAQFLNIPDAVPKKKQTFIVVHDSEIKTALIVDKITGTRLLYRNEDLELKNSSSESIAADFLAGSALFLQENVENEMNLLNVKNILSSVRLKWNI